jgi:hypothetical protein
LVDIEIDPTRNRPAHQAPAAQAKLQRPAQASPAMQGAQDSMSALPTTLGGMGECASSSGSWVPAASDDNTPGALPRLLAIALHMLQQACEALGFLQVRPIDVPVPVCGDTVKTLILRRK